MARTTRAVLVAVAASLTSVAPGPFGEHGVAVAAPKAAKAAEAPKNKPKSKAGQKKKAAGSGKGIQGAQGGAGKPAADLELPRVIERARVERRLEGGPTFVTTTGDGGLFVHVDFGVSPRHDPEGRPGMSELAARTWFAANLPLWNKVSTRGGSASLSLRGDRFGVALALPRGEEGFVAWLLPRLFDHTAPPAEVVAGAMRRIEAERDPAHDALVENLYQGARALSHRADPEKLAGVEPAEIATFLRATFAPERATIGVVAAEGVAVCDAACAAGFASLAGRAGAVPPMPTPPEQTLQRTAHLDLGGAPAITYGFLFPNDPRRETALRVAGAALCDDRAGRLAAKLRLIGARCAAHLEVRDGPGIFTLRIEGAEETELGKTIARVDEELLALSKSPLPRNDLAHARDGALVAALEEAASPARVAEDLAQGRPDPAAFVANASAMDGAALATELARGLDPLRRVVVVERRGTERLWKTPRPKSPPPSKNDGAKKPNGKPGSKAPAKRRP